MGLYGKIIDLQKLHMAWNKVRKNKPAAGIDDITWEQFDARKTEELKGLNKELADHIYTPMPVNVVSCIPCLKHEYCLISGDLHIKRAIPPAFVYNVHRQTHIIEKRGIAHGHYTVITFNHQ